MFELDSYTQTPEGLVVADRANLMLKLSNFTLSNIHLVFDFDRTLTVRKPGTNDEVTTWHILRDHLPEEAQKQYQELFSKYRLLELDEEMTQSDAVDWWSSILQLFATHRINLSVVEHDFLQRANIRPGSTELFEFCKQKNIPTVILSAGIQDVIEIWCRKYGIQPTLVISTLLSVNEDMEIVGWEEDTLVHVLNKSETGHDELRTIRVDRPNVIVIGDSIDDASMAEGENNALRIRLLDRRHDESTKLEEEYRRTFARFDALIDTETLGPINKLLSSIK